MEQISNLNIEEAVKDSFEDSLDQFTQEQRKQLLAGYDAQGNLIGDNHPYKNADYAFDKYRLNPLPGLGNPDLKLTGDFQSEINISVGTDVLSIDSSDSKTIDLEGKYGNIFGLSGSFKQDFIDSSLRPLVIENIRKQIGL